MYKEYSWRTGWTSGDANKVGAELDTIEKSNELTAENVVNYARTHQDSELYGMFEWDDSIAGELWRKSRASTIISNIMVKIIEEDDVPKNDKPIKAFVQTIEKKVYEPIEVVIEDVNKYQILLEKAYKELNRTKEKYVDLKEIQELLKDIPEM